RPAPPSALRVVAGLCVPAGPSRHRPLLEGAAARGHVRSDALVPVPDSSASSSPATTLHALGGAGRRAASSTGQLVRRGGSVSTPPSGAARRAVRHRGSGTRPRVHHT